MTTPTTEAGRRHVEYCITFMGDDAAREVLAIEAEARADPDLTTAYMVGFEKGKAEARADLAARLTKNALIEAMKWITVEGLSGYEGVVPDYEVTAARLIAALEGAER